jgi:hypothetical protein
MVTPPTDAVDDAELDVPDPLVLVGCAGVFVHAVATTRSASALPTERNFSFMCSCR